MAKRTCRYYITERAETTYIGSTELLPTEDMDDSELWLGRESTLRYFNIQFIPDDPKWTRFVEPPVDSPIAKEALSHPNEPATQSTPSPLQDPAAFSSEDGGFRVTEWDDFQMEEPGAIVATYTTIQDAIKLCRALARYDRAQHDMSHNKKTQDGVKVDTMTSYCVSTRHRRHLASWEDPEVLKYPTAEDFNLLRTLHPKDPCQLIVETWVREN